MDKIDNFKFDPPYQWKGPNGLYIVEVETNQKDMDIFHLRQDNGDPRNPQHLGSFHSVPDAVEAANRLPGA